MEGKVEREGEEGKGKRIGGITFLRGGSVCVLVILRCEQEKNNQNNNNNNNKEEEEGDGEEYTIITVQPRLAVGNMFYHEIPAGMLDDSSLFSGGLLPLPSPFFIIILIMFYHLYYLITLLLFIIYLFIYYYYLLIFIIYSLYYLINFHLKFI